MMFYVGQKVVCVDDAPRNTHAVPIKNGTIYTVRWSGVFVFGPHGTIPAVRLFGIEDYGYWFGAPVHDYPFGAHRFRAVVERKTDISIFTKLLVPSEREMEGA